MTIYEFAAFYKIQGINEDMRSSLQLMEELSSYTYNGDKVGLGYIVDQKENTLRIPKGMGLATLQSKYRRFDFVDQGVFMPFKDNVKRVKINKKPYDYQVDIKDRVMKNFDKGTQAIIDLPTGKGKTLTALFIVECLNLPTLIIVKDTALKEQWIEKSLLGNTNITMDDICLIKGTNSIPLLETLHKPYPIYIMSHSAIRSIVGMIKYTGFNKLLMTMGVGIKIIDEFDMEFRNIIELDLNTSIRYNLYLTATVLKSNKSENAVFQKSFNTVFRCGKEYFKDEKPNRDCVVVDFKSHPDKRERYICYNFKGDMSPYKYNDYLFNEKKEMLIKLIGPYIKEFLSEYPPEDKCLIFCEKIESCDIMVSILYEHFGIKYNDIGVINTSITEDVKRKSIHKKFIISTIKSCGRGLDIKDLTYQINLETYASIATLIQQAGRVGRNGGKKGKMIFFIDNSFLPIIMYNKGKLKELDGLFDKIEYLYYDSKEDKYVNDKLLI